MLSKNIIIPCILITLAGCGCASTEGSGQGLRLLPDITCKGKASITGTGNISANSIAGGAASNSWNIQADCGEGGFSLIHHAQEQSINER